MEEKFRHLFTTRTDEYTKGALAFVNGESFPVKLAQTLSHNLLLPENRTTDKEQKELWEAAIMFCVAMPFVTTFATVMKKFR